MKQPPAPTSGAYDPAGQGSHAHPDGTPAAAATPSRYASWSAGSPEQPVSWQPSEPEREAARSLPTPKRAPIETLVAEPAEWPAAPSLEPPATVPPGVLNTASSVEDSAAGSPVEKPVPSTGSRAPGSVSNPVRSWLRRATNRGRTWLSVGVVAAVLVLLVGGGYLVSTALFGDAKDGTSGRSSAPVPSVTSTASAKTFEAFTLNGNTLTGDGFIATLPKGWELSSTNGSKNQGELIDGNANFIDYYSNLPNSAATNCDYQAASVATAAGVESSTPPVAVDGVIWAGKATKGVKTTVKRANQKAKEVVGLYCLDDKGLSYMIRTVAWEADDASVTASAKALMAGWTWQ